MEATLQKLNQLSFEIVSNLSVSGLDEITNYMSERDQLFAKLQECTLDSTPAKELKPLVDKILQMDTMIVGRMLELRNEADHELNKLANARMAKSTYDDTHADHESYFFDTKR